MNQILFTIRLLPLHVKESQELRGYMVDARYVVNVHSQVSAHAV
jgi:hypothetical protein